MMLTKKMEDFLNTEKADIENNQWDSLFNQAIIEDINIYSLSKILTKADINFDFKYRNSGNLLYLLSKLTTLQLADLLRKLSPAGTIIIENYDGRIYFKYKLGHQISYLNKDKAPLFIYNTLLKWLTGEINGMKDSKFYNDLFSMYDIAGHKDPAIMDLMTTGYTDYDYSKTNDLWEDRPL